MPAYPATALGLHRATPLSRDLLRTGLPGRARRDGPQDLRSHRWTFVFWETGALTSPALAAKPHGRRCTVWRPRPAGGSGRAQPSEPDRCGTPVVNSSSVAGETVSDLGTLEVVRGVQALQGPALDAHRDQHGPAGTPGAAGLPVGSLGGRRRRGLPTIEERRFGQEVEFRHDGRPFLHYRSQASCWTTTATRCAPPGQRDRVLAGRRPR